MSADSCPRCGWHDIEENPDTDMPGADPDFGCPECLHTWDERTELDDMTLDQLEAML